MITEIALPLLLGALAGAITGTISGALFALIEFKRSHAQCRSRNVPTYSEGEKKT